MLMAVGCDHAGSPSAAILQWRPVVWNQPARGRGRQQRIGGHILLSRRIPAKPGTPQILLITDHTRILHLTPLMERSWRDCSSRHDCSKLTVYVFCAAANDRYAADGGLRAPERREGREQLHGIFPLLTQRPSGTQLCPPHAVRSSPSPLTPSQRGIYYHLRGISFNTYGPDRIL